MIFLLQLQANNLDVIKKNDLPFDHKSRSACLQRLGKSSLSLEDIDAAIKAGYPKDKLYKVLPNIYFLMVIV